MLLKHTIDLSEHARHLAFPISKSRIFMAHAGVTALPRCVVERMHAALHSGMVDQQENESVFRAVEETREIAGRMIQAQPQEISLIGPTALGLNLVAQGLPWKEGDEVVYYPDDYPANVYPWKKLEERGVTVVPLTPEKPGHITPGLVQAALSPKTKLVALASCHFLTGYRIDYQSIGEMLKRRDILFCLDGIQTLGAFRLDSKYFDFLSADSHKWLLGPLGAGIFYVKESLQEKLEPSLVGSWNIQSPRFIAQTELKPEYGARRYECGSLYVHGILGMRAGMEMLQEVGLEAIETRILQLSTLAANSFRELGFTILADSAPESARSGIVTISKSGTDHHNIFQNLQRNHVSASLRWDRAGQAFLRFSPHFYNTEEEISKVAQIVRQSVG